MRYGSVMRDTFRGISATSFAASLGLIVFGLIAFPLYQGFITGGFLFYTTGIDEAQHLSFSYADYIATGSGRMRYSSYLVVLLHKLGLGGGYINLCFDIVCAILSLIFTKRAFVKFGYQLPIARCASLLLFILPLLFTPFNPLVGLLSSVHFDPAIMMWVSIPWNRETPFIRSPEPQMSWLIVSAAVSVTAGSRFLPWALLLISPFLYTFVQLPIIFVALTLLALKRVAVPTALVTSFLICSLMTVVYKALVEESPLSRFFIVSHLPLVSWSGLVGLVLVLLTRSRLPKGPQTALTVLIASLWAIDNTQLISGYLVTPVNFENYWGVAVLGCVATLLIVHLASHSGYWIGLTMALYAAFSVTLFTRNNTVFQRLEHPREVLPLLSTSSAHVACEDLYLTTYLDLVHPMQPPTVFSWTRALNLSSDVPYDDYLCSKAIIQDMGPPTSEDFKPIFQALDWGFQSRGADMFMSIGRQPIPTFPQRKVPKDTGCARRELIVVKAGKGS
jgi:hypothetical protein